MNVVVLVIDTLRTDCLGLYGSKKVRTPHLDAFAAQSLVFDEAYMGSFPTIPMRTDLFTGRFGEPFHPWMPLNFVEPTLPQVLTKAGYATQFIFDCPHLMQGGHGFDRPFNAWEMIRGAEVDRYRLDDKPVSLPGSKGGRAPEKAVRQFHAQYARNWRGVRREEDTHTGRLSQAACRWLEENQGHKNFLLWIESFAPHEPWMPPRHYYESYLDGPDLDVPLTHATDASRFTEQERHCLWARYAGYVTMVDSCVGRIFDKLEQLGRMKDTIVVVMSDHGTYVGDHGKMATKGPPFYDCIARIVTIIRVPAGPRNGRHTKAVVQPPDLMPTVLDLLGMETPAGCQGRSCREVLMGKRDTHRRAAISGALFGVQQPQLDVAVRQGGWCLMEGPNKRVRELYHTAEDPEQARDLIASQPEKAEELRRVLLEHLRQHEAPPQVERLVLTGDPGDLSDYRLSKHVVPGFRYYWENIHQTPEAWITTDAPPGSWPRL
jgi:arylsulfatase A-like enzyme